MKGATAEPLDMIRMPIWRSMTIMDRNHHLFLTFRNPQDSLKISILHDILLKQVFSWNSAIQNISRLVPNLEGGDEIFRASYNNE